MGDVKNIGDARKDKEESAPKKEEGDFTFEELMKRNEENRKRMQKEREKANKGVIRSYRLKH